jgi:hypothetical protein
MTEQAAAIPRKMHGACRMPNIATRATKNVAGMMKREDCIGGVCEAGWNRLWWLSRLARCATKEFPPVAANDIANCNEVSCPIVEGSDRAMADAAMNLCGVRGSGFDDLFH